MSLISAYADESSDKDRRILSVSAFVGEAEEWSFLLADWIERLKPANLPNPVTAFHMTDCETGNGEFSEKNGWDHSSRQKLIIDLISIISRRRVALFGVGMQLKDYSSLELIDGQPLGKSEYHFLLQAVMGGISMELEETKADRLEDVSYFFDQNAKNEYWANEIHRALRSDKRVNWSHRIGPLIFGSKEKIRLLQVADLGAYETMKYVTNSIFGEGRSRRSFEALASEKKIAKILVYDGKTLNTMLENKRNELARIFDK